MKHPVIHIEPAEDRPEITIRVSSLDQAKQLQMLLHRALNTWSGAPAWALALADDADDLVTALSPAPPL